jgi:hypothetical protein
MPSTRSPPSTRRPRRVHRDWGPIRARRTNAPSSQTMPVRSPLRFCPLEQLDELDNRTDAWLDREGRFVGQRAHQRKPTSTSLAGVRHRRRQRLPVQPLTLIRRGAGEAVTVDVSESTNAVASVGRSSSVRIGRSWCDGRSDRRHRIRSPSGRRANLPDEYAPLPFVGRRPELDTLRAWWREHASSIRMILLTGEAGDGRTRLATAFAREARMC